MKKRGLAAFICYIIGLVFAGAIFVIAYIAAQNIPEPDVENWGAWAVAVLILCGLVIGVPSAALFVVKSLHLLTNVKLFGILCIIGDLVLFLYMLGVHNIFMDGLDYWITYSLPQTFLPSLFYLIPLFSNIRSIKE